MSNLEARLLTPGELIQLARKVETWHHNEIFRFLYQGRIEGIKIEFSASMKNDYLITAQDGKVTLGEKLLLNPNESELNLGDDPRKRKIYKVKKTYYKARELYREIIEKSVTKSTPRYIEDVEKEAERAAIERARKLINNGN